MQNTILSRFSLLACLAVIGFVGFNLPLYRDATFPAIGHVGLYTPIILLLYPLVMRSLCRCEKQPLGEYVEERAERYAQTSMRQASWGFAISSAAAVAAGIWLPFIAKDLGLALGWERSLVGTLPVAAVTSAPEAVATLATLRLGAVDLAIGNLLGSNLFAIDDLAYLPGPLLADVSIAHAASSFLAMMMSGLAVVGLLLRPQSRVLRSVSWISLMLLVIYLPNSLFLYLHGQ